MADDVKIEIQDMRKRGYLDRAREISEYASNIDVERRVVDRIMSIIDNEDSQPYAVMQAVNQLQNLISLHAKLESTLKQSQQTSKLELPPSINFIVTKDVNN